MKTSELEKLKIGDTVICITKMEVTMFKPDFIHNLYINKRKVSDLPIEEILENRETYTKFEEGKKYTIRTKQLNEFSLKNEKSADIITQQDLLENFVIEKEYRKMKLETLSDNNFSEFLKNMKK